MILSATLRGTTAQVVRITTARNVGLRGLHIHGLAGAAQREARVRVQAALEHVRNGIEDYVEVSCDASGATIDGAGIDLAIAMSIAAGDNDERRIAAIGELSLSGEVRPVRGTLAAVEALKDSVDVVLVAQENASEAALVSGVRVLAVRHLRDALEVLNGDERHADAAVAAEATEPVYADMRDVLMQDGPRRALEIAAVGMHNVLLVGGPGAGKTMLARRLTGILPPMTRTEAVEVTRVHSVAGLNIGGGLITTRPFRAPHHSTTPPGLVGGGASMPRPGEVSLAHHGILFLDELPEFARPTLEVLREPLVTGEVLLARASGTLRYPARCIVVGSMPPCPCGRFGTARCRCCVSSRARYQGRVPRPLVDQFELRIEVPALDLAAMDKAAPSESSAPIRERVTKARALLATTVELSASSLDELARRALMIAGDTLTAQRTALRLAASIAALDGKDRPGALHAEEAAKLVANGARLVPPPEAR